MTTMTTNRCYWVDWICLFDKQPTPKAIQQKYSRMKKYIEGYLKDLPTIKDTKEVPPPLLEYQEEWDAVKLKWCRKSPSSKSVASNKSSTAADWIKLLKMEWDQMSDKPRVYNFKAYFESDKKRYTGNTKGTMTPPAPPTPPGQL